MYRKLPLPVWFSGLNLVYSLISPIHATYNAPLILLHLITLVGLIFCEEFKL